MKRKVMLSLFVIFLAAAIIGGATLAWFTAKADAPPAEFVAGTVMVEADAVFDVEEQFENINPGDCYCAGWVLRNVGSKAIELRIIGSGTWELSDEAIEYLQENWYGLCFHETYGEYGVDSWDAFLSAFGVAAAVGSPTNPAAVTPCPYGDSSDWVVVLVDEDGNPTQSFPDVHAFHLYYKGGPIAPGEEVELCLCVLFHGPLMDNKFQAATFKLSGMVEAVQASNNAPSEVWGDLWTNTELHEITDPRFVGFDFSQCKDQEGNAPAPCCVEPDNGGSTNGQ